MWAMVVFPTPGGPQRIMEGIRPCSITLRKMLPLPVRCSWPIKSSSVEGRSLSAKGMEVFTLEKYKKSKANPVDSFENQIRNVNTYSVNDCQDKRLTQRSFKQVSKLLHNPEIHLDMDSKNNTNKNHKIGNGFHDG